MRGLTGYPTIGYGQKIVFPANAGINRPTTTKRGQQRGVFPANAGINRRSQEERIPGESVPRECGD